MTRKVADFATGKPVDIGKPNERVRQEQERILVESYSYPTAHLDIEGKIPRGSGYFRERADIVIYDSAYGRDPAEHVPGIVEVKRPARKDGLAQLKSYMTATSAAWGLWTNGSDIAFLCRHGRQIVGDYLNNVPAYGQSIEDVGRLERSDLRPFARSELKAAFRRILRTLYANTNISRNVKERKKELAAKSFFGIDKETDLVRIAKAHMAIEGDGRSNIVHENSLHDADAFAADAKAHRCSCPVTSGRRKAGTGSQPER